MKPGRRDYEILDDMHLAWRAHEDWERRAKQDQEHKAYLVVCGILTAVILLAFCATRL